MQFIEDAKKRKDELQRELNAINKFLAFYVEEQTVPVSPDLKINAAVAAKLISVRLGNALHAIIRQEGREPDTFTLSDLQKLFGSSLTAESTHRLMTMPNFGRKGLNELSSLLERIDDNAKATGA